MRFPCVFLALTYDRLLFMNGAGGFSRVHFIGHNARSAFKICLSLHYSSTRVRFGVAFSVCPKVGDSSNDLLPIVAANQSAFGISPVMLGLAQPHAGSGLPACR